MEGESMALSIESGARSIQAIDKRNHSTRNARPFPGSVPPPAADSQRARACSIHGATRSSMAGSPSALKE